MTPPFNTEQARRNTGRPLPVPQAALLWHYHISRYVAWLRKCEAVLSLAHLGYGITATQSILSARSTEQEDMCVRLSSLYIAGKKTFYGTLRKCKLALGTFLK